MVNQQTIDRRILFFLLIISLFSCSPEEEDNKNDPENTFQYFISRTDSLVLDRSTLGERLNAEDNTPIILLLPEKEIVTNAIRYRTKSPTGNTIEASGLVTYPKEGTFKGVIVAHNYTISANSEAPTTTMATIESAFAMLGYVVITPDQIGFGATVDLPQTYIHAESSARVSVDMLFAAREFMASTGKGITNDIFITGYSQGGFSALAMMRLIESEYAATTSIKRVYAGGGPYDPASMFHLIAERDIFSMPAVIPLSIIGLDYADGLNIDYSQLFLEPLLSHYEEWLISKKYTLGQIARIMGTNKISEFIHPKLTNDDSNSEVVKLYTSLEKNNLTNWKPKAPLMLTHGKNDEVVPYENAQKAYDAFRKAGCPVTLNSVETKHKDTAILFYLSVVNGLLF